MNRLKQLLQEKCPDGVEYKTLGELEDSGLLTLGRGKVLSKKYLKKNKGDYPVFSAAQTNNGVIGYCNTFMFNDIRLTWSIDGGGKFFYRDNEKYSVTNVCGWLKVNDESKVNVKYLYHALTNAWMFKVYDYTHKAHPSVIREEYVLPIPPIEVQVEIANILDSYSSAKTELVSKMTAELALRKKQYAYYQEKLLTFGDDVEYKTLGELENLGLLTLGRGKVLSKKYLKKNNGDYPVFSAAQTNNGVIGYCNTFMFDDIRLTWSIDGGGKFFYRDNEKYSVTNVCGWLKVNDESEVNVKYLYHALTNAWIFKVYDYTHKAHPSVIREEYVLPIPTIERQTEIANILDSYRKAEAELEEKLEADIIATEKQYEYYRDKILTF